MKTDSYTKTALTIIAACLVWLCVKPVLIKPVHASKQEIINVNIEQVSGRAIYKAVPVEIKKE